MENKMVFSSTESVISELPNFFGFSPRESIVLVGVTHNQVVLTARSDLPPSNDWTRFAEYVASMLVSHADSAIIVIVHPNGEAYRGLVEMLRRRLTCLDDVWVPRIAPGEWWQCYSGCCGGSVHDTTASTLAVSSAINGFPRYATREELAHSLAPTPEIDRTTLKHEIEKWLSSQNPPRSLRDAAAPLTTALQCLRAGQSLETPHITAALGALHQNVHVRDAMFAQHDTDTALQLWTILVRYAPDAYVADPAALLAACAHCRGDGPLANVALERALEADPEHRCALLLREAAQLAPRELVAICASFAADTNLPIGE